MGYTHFSRKFFGKKAFEGISVFYNILEKNGKKGISPDTLSEVEYRYAICQIHLPNSASCERVFSLLENMFRGDQQMSSLADQVCAALMLAYNKRRLG